MPRKFIRTEWEVDTRNLNRKIASLAAGFKDAGSLSLKTVGEMGKAYARSIAPRQSGRTVQNIILMRNDGTEARIVAKNPTASDGHTRGAASARYYTRGKFNLVRWMHTSANAARHINTGDEQFMYSTADYLRRVAPGLVESEFNKVVKKNN